MTIQRKELTMKIRNLKRNRLDSADLKELIDEEVFESEELEREELKKEQKKRHHKMEKRMMRR